MNHLPIMKYKLKMTRCCWVLFSDASNVFFLAICASSLIGTWEGCNYKDPQTANCKRIYLVILYNIVISIYPVMSIWHTRHCLVHVRYIFYFLDLKSRKVLQKSNFATMRGTNLTRAPPVDPRWRRDKRTNAQMLIQTLDEDSHLLFS